MTNQQMDDESHNSGYYATHGADETELVFKVQSAGQTVDAVLAAEEVTAAEHTALKELLTILAHALNAGVSNARLTNALSKALLLASKYQVNTSSTYKPEGLEVVKPAHYRYKFRKVKGKKARIEISPNYQTKVIPDERQGAAKSAEVSSDKNTVVGSTVKSVPSGIGTRSQSTS